MSTSKKRPSPKTPPPPVPGAPKSLALHKLSVNDLCMKINHPLDTKNSAGEYLMAGVENLFPSWLESSGPGVPRNWREIVQNAFLEKFVFQNPAETPVAMKAVLDAVAPLFESSDENNDDKKSKDDSGFKRPRRVGFTPPDSAATGADKGKKKKDPLAPPPLTGSNVIKHFSYTCPGLHGPDSRQEIRPAPMDELIRPGAPQLIIPLFQRRYCWEEKILTQWFVDVIGSVGSTPDHMKEAAIVDTSKLNAAANRNVADNKRHRVGKIVLKSLPDGSIYVIDGQQRITTTLLAICASRDAAIKVGDQELVDRLDAALVRDMKAWKEWKKAQTPWKPLDEGNKLDFATLSPSYADRSSFFEVMSVGAIPGATYSATTKNSLQYKAYSLFSGYIETGLKNGASIRSIAAAALDGVSVMRINILNDINYGQVFVWLQEKSIFGMGALLYNPTPGESFKAGDFVRNLLLSSFMGDDMDALEETFYQLWMKPIDLPSGGAAGVEKLLQEFMKTVPPADPGSLEQILGGIDGSVPGLTVPPSIWLYAKFVTLYESMAGEDPTDEHLAGVGKHLLSELSKHAEKAQAKKAAQDSSCMLM